MRRTDSAQEHSRLSSRTVAAAERLARRCDLVDHVDYRGLPLVLANEANRAIYRTLCRFPAIRPMLCFVGEGRAYGRLSRKRLLDLWVAAYARSHPDWPPKRARQEARFWLDVSCPVVLRKRVCRAAALDGKFLWQPPGIAFDARTIAPAIEASDARRLCDHELGHIFDFMLGVSRLKSIQRLSETMPDDPVCRDNLTHLWPGPSELVAYGWSSFCNEAKPSPVATKIGQAILKRYRSKFRRKRRRNGAESR